MSSIQHCPNSSLNINKTKIEIKQNYIKKDKYGRCSNQPSLFLDLRNRFPIKIFSNSLEESEEFPSVEKFSKMDAVHLDAGR